MSFGERLRSGLALTRAKIAASFSRFSSAEAPDWDSLEEALLSADVGVAATRELLNALKASRDSDPRSFLRQRIVGLLAEAESRSAPVQDGLPRVLLIVGVNGVGKTTTLAKLAHRFAVDGKSVLIVAADTFRAAAVEQLETWARRARVDFVHAKEGADPAAVVHDGIQAARARGRDLVLIDTAGRLHTKLPLMEELLKLKRVAGKLVPGAPHETLLVLDAAVGANGLQQARRFKEVLGVDAVVLTKLDGTARGGIAVAVARELGLPVRFAGVGEDLDDLIPFSKEEFAEALL